MRFDICTLTKRKELISMALIIRKHYLYGTKEKIGLNLLLNGHYNPDDQSLKLIPGIQTLTVSDHQLIVFFANSLVGFEVMATNVPIKAVEHLHSVTEKSDQYMIENKNKMYIHVKKDPEFLLGYELIIIPDERAKILSKNEDIPLCGPYDDNR